MSRRMLSIFAFELGRNLRRKAYLFTTFGIPLLGIVLLLGYQVLSAGGDGGSPFGGPFGGPMRGIPGLDVGGIRRAGYVDHSGLFGDPGELSSLLARYPDEAAVRAALEAGELQVYYVIPPDYLETGAVSAVMPRLNLSAMNDDLIRRLLLNRLARDIDQPDVFDRLVNPADIQTVAVQPDTADEVARGEGGAFFVVYLFAIVLLMSLFVTNGYLMQSVIEEKENRLVEILLASVRPLELLAGKILAMGALGLLQILVWLGGIFLAARLGGVDAFAGQALGIFVNLSIPPNLILLLLVYFVLAYLMFAAGYSIVGALSNSVREGPQYAAIFTLPAVVPLWFTQLFATAPDAPLAVGLSLFPLTAPLAMIQRLAITTVPAWQIIASLALLALTVVGAMALAARVFRVQTLLAGHLPRLRDLPRLVRG